MANPSINIKNQPNISDEVPGEQKIREVDSYQNNDSNNSSIVTDTLSPVITVTKKETTLTKGELKLQKVTVTEDISTQEINDVLQTNIETNKQANMSNEHTEYVTEEVVQKEDKIREKRKSRIPQFKQTVERVKKERREQRKEQEKKTQSTPRRSSIPKLKDAKLVKRQSSLFSDSNSEPTSLEHEVKVEDEFDKIYEEIIDTKQKNIDDKILAVKIDDPEKIESKFEEIIHAYDSNDDNHQTNTEKLRSKIPFRRKDDGASRFASLADRVKSNNSAANSKLKDGGFKVSAATIKTKRFSKSNSIDLGDTKNLIVVESIDIQNGNEKKVVKETIITETTEGIPLKTKVFSRSVKRQLSLSDENDTELNKNDGKSKVTNEEIDKMEEVEGKITKQTITRQNIRTGIPIKPERMNRSISKELNKRPPSLHDRDFVYKEVMKQEELKDGSSRTMIKETFVKETPVEIEKITRGLSRTFSRDGKTITLSPKMKEFNKEESQLILNETNVKENNNIDTVKIESIETQKLEPEIRRETLITENILKESIDISIPYAKTTHSYTKGKIQNVEITKTIEWTQAEEIIPRKYVRTNSENKSNNNEVNCKKFAPTVIKKDVYVEAKLETDEIKYTDNETSDTQTYNDTNFIDTSKPATDTTLLNKTDFKTSNNFKNIRTENENISQNEKVTENINLPVQEKESNKENATVLKGNVNRLISQISVKESLVSKKEVNVEDELPKKRSVLSKIAIFEGKEPAEFTIKIKKSFIGKKSSNTITKENNEHKYQPKLDLNIDVNKVENIPSGVRNTPIIVDQIWKFEEQTIHNRAIHQIEDITILPGPIDFTVNENSFESAQILVEGEGGDTNEAASTLPDETDNQVQEMKILPAHLDFIHVENQTEEAQGLPAKIYFESENISQPEEAVTLPAKIDFTTNENHDNIVKYSTEKVEIKNKQSLNEEKKPKVGKLDLSLWQKQIEDNKQSVSMSKPVEIQTPQILPGKVVFEKNELDIQTPVILPGKIEIKSEIHHDIPTILPGKIDFMDDDRRSEVHKTLHSRIDLVLNKEQLEVPVVLPETPLTKSGKMFFDTQRSQIEFPVILPGKIEFTPDLNKVDTPELPEIINFGTANNAVESAQILPAQVDFNIEQSDSPKVSPDEFEVNSYENKVETPTLLPGRLDIETAETPKILPEYIDFKINDNTVETSKPYFYSYAKYNEVKEPSDISIEDIEIKPEVLKTGKNNINIDREVPSDPELVDSEPEIKETEDTIMGKLNNKVFFISNKRKALNKHIKEETASFNDEFNSEDNDRDNRDYKSEDFNTKSYIERRSITREEFKRTKSLAELDLGDVVKGQVQRMVYRIKSVDFDKLEQPKARKISVKEMPRKSSVLEKIALFEGKSASTRAERTERPEKIPTTVASTNVTQALNETGPTPEEVYLQKVEDLSTAKVHYGKMDMLYLKLGNNVQMPVIGLGTALMEPSLTPHIVSAAIDLGYRAIDTAYIYGNEREVGQAIKSKIDDGTVRREDLYIMSKLWSTFHHPDLVETACRASLEALGLEYFDLFMIHNPMSFKEGGEPIPKIATVIQFSEHDYLDAWFSMEKLVSKGLVKSIGVSNFNSQQIQRILDKGRIRPVVNQVECHPYLSQKRLQMYCSERNITLSCFGVLGSKGTPTEYTSGVSPVIDDPLVQVMASGLNVTAAQLLVRYHIQSGRNVVVKASTAAHLWGILQALTFQLEQHQIDALSALNRNKRIFTFKGMGDTHKNYPFRAPY